MQPIISQGTDDVIYSGSKFPFIFLNKVLFTVSLLVFSSVVLMSSPSTALQQLQVGMTAPNFSLTALSGGTTTFATVRGTKNTAIVVWSTWDRKSEHVLARMQVLYEKLRAQGFSVVAINANGQNIPEHDIAQIRATVERLKLTFPVFIDHGLNYFYDLGVIALPTTVIVDRDRTILYELPGYPLVGSEEMADFIIESIEGKKLAVAPISGYRPNKESLRFFNMGSKSLKSGTIADGAELWFKKSIAADPGFVQPYISLGKFYLQRGDTIAAEAQFKEALAKDPKNVMALCEMALLHIYGDRLLEGSALLESALTLDETYAPCYYYAGLAYGRRGMLDQALKMFDSAENRTKADHNVFLFRGRVLEEHNRKREAVDAYRKALEAILMIQ